MRTKTIRVEEQRRYRMSPAEAWRLLADTDHLNRSVGLPPVEFRQLPDPLLRGAQAKALRFFPVRWREFPFEWVRERRYVVRREFENGPMNSLEVGIELTPAGDDDVIVKSFADFTADNVAGRLLWRLGRGPVGDLLNFCDRYLARKASGRADPVPTPEARAEIDTDRLELLLAQLRAAPVRPDLIGPLRERIVEGSDDQLVRVRAFALADTWHADRLEVLRLMLYATRCGLFELSWELMCPNCRVPKDEVDRLANLPVRFHCEICGISYAADFDESVELRFSIHPSVREAADQIYCIGGPLRMPHIAAQQYLRPGEEREITTVPSTPLQLRTVGSTRRLPIVSGPRNQRIPTVKVTYADGTWVAPHSLAGAGTLELPKGSALSLRNQTGGPVLAVLEDDAWTTEATTAARVTALQEFRDLFSSEVLAPGQEHAIRHIALVFSDLKGSTRMYEGIGDAAAYSRVNRHFDFIRQAVARAGGAIVKTMGDGVMCAFPLLDDAFETAIAMQEQAAAWCREQHIDPPLTLKLGVHAGPVIATTANDRLDYFGRTVNIAARLGDHSQGHDVVLLGDVFAQAFEQVTGDRANLTVEKLAGQLRGLNGLQQLARVSVGPAADETASNRSEHVNQLSPPRPEADDGRNRA
jgi:adenylate cyclase